MNKCELCGYDKDHVMYVTEVGIICCKCMDKKREKETKHMNENIFEYDEDDFFEDEMPLDMFDACGEMCAEEDCWGCGEFESDLEEDDA